MTQKELYELARKFVAERWKESEVSDYDQAIYAQCIVDFILKYECDVLNFIFINRGVE